MRVPALFAVIALAAFNPAARWAAASSAQGANSGPAATLHQSSDANVRRGVEAKKLTSARPASIHVAPQRLNAASRTAPNRGHFTPYKFNTGTAPGLSRNAVGSHAFAAPVLGGRTEYDAKKGGIIGGPAIGHKR